MTYPSRLPVTAALSFLCLFSVSNGQNLSNPLAGASSYNLFTFAGLTLANSDSEGRVAVGGNASFTNYGIATGFVSNPSSAGNSLLVKGNVSYSNTEVKFGNIRYGGTQTGSVSVPNGTNTKGATLDFNSIKNDLLLTAANLSQAASTGIITNAGGDVKLYGTRSDVNVFNLSGSALSGAWRLSVDTPAGSSVLVNVSGLTTDFDNMTYQFTGTNGNGLTDARHTLFNFYESTNLSISSVGIGGSVLAPKAAVAFNWAQLNGNLVADSVNGTGEVHNLLFSGNLTGLSSVPEPSFMAISAFGAMALLLRRRR